MTGRISRSAAALLLAGLTAGLLAACAGRVAPDKRRDLFQWVDGEGDVRYTSDPQRIPIEYRLGMQKVEAGMSAVENAAELPGAEIVPGAKVEEPDWVTSEVPSAPPVMGGAVETLEIAPEMIPSEIPVDPFNGAEAAVAVFATEVATERVEAIDERVIELEIAIARDQETVKILISDVASASELRSSPELATVALRLPRMQAELRDLKAERARVLSGDGS